MPDRLKEKSGNYPTPFQKQTLWTAINLISIVVIGMIVVGLIFLSTKILGFLQPLLVPLAVAGIIAYLLDPLVHWLKKRNIPEPRAVFIVFVSFILGVILLGLSVIPAAVGQAGRLVNNREKIKDKAQTYITKTVETAKKKYVSGPIGETLREWDERKLLDTLSDKYPILAQRAWTFVTTSIQGVFGIFGYAIGLFLVPVYLFFFMKESTAISQQWTHYLPLKASRFKDEVVGTLSEINGYLIAFFRGQMLVSMIDGALIAIVLMILGLPYAILIGVFVALLGLIPYIGNILCLIPAVLISIAHFSDPGNQLFGITQVWIYPLIVAGVFFVTQQINGLFTAPKIVGDSVGLHPLTVIFSVLFWSLLIGGLLGSLLAVPLTASVKVLFRRYIWERRLAPQDPSSEDASDLRAA